MEKDINNSNYVKNQNPYNKYKQYIGKDGLKKLLELKLKIE